MRQRGLVVQRAEAAWLSDCRLAFDKQAADHQGAGHACLVWARGQRVEGVLYWLADARQIERLDQFERTPVNYSRDIVAVGTAAGPLGAWTYFANPAVLRPGLRPPRAYLEHLLAGRGYLSRAYLGMLEGWPCAEDRA